MSDLTERIRQAARVLRLGLLALAMFLCAAQEWQAAAATLWCAVILYAGDDA